MSAPIKLLTVPAPPRIGVRSRSRAAHDSQSKRAQPCLHWNHLQLMLRKPHVSAVYVCVYVAKTNKYRTLSVYLMDTAHYGAFQMVATAATMHRSFESAFFFASGRQLLRGQHLGVGQVGFESRSLARPSNGGTYESPQVVQN